MAIALGVRVCGLGYFLEAGANCRAMPGSATEVAEELQRRLGQGAPGAYEVLAAVAVNRGEALWRLGRAEDAEAAFLTGVPTALRPLVAGQERRPWRSVGPLAGTGLEFEAPVATGSPWRVLQWLAYLHAEAGNPAIADLYGAAARAGGGENASRP